MARRKNEHLGDFIGHEDEAPSDRRTFPSISERRISAARGAGKRTGQQPRHRRRDRLRGRARSPDNPGGLSGARWCHRSEEHTSELQSLMRISYAVFCLKKTIHIIFFSYSSFLLSLLHLLFHSFYHHI